MKIKQTLQNIWAIEDNRNIIKDGAIFGAVTIVFHFLYWNTNMNSWLFGPFTTDVFDFFTRLAYNGTHILLNAFSSYPFVAEGMSFHFYDDLGTYATITIIHDCSAIKQCMQFLLVMIFCPNKWYKRLLYFIIGSIIILLCNIVRFSIRTRLGCTSFNVCCNLCIMVCLDYIFCKKEKENQD